MINLVAALFLLFQTQAMADWVISAGYNIGMGSNNAGKVGVWDKAPNAVDNTALNKNPAGLGAAFGYEGLSWGTRLTYDQMAVSNKSADLQSSANGPKITFGTVDARYNSTQYGLDLYFRTKGGQASSVIYYAGFGAMMVESHLEQTFSYITSGGSTLANGKLEATGDSAIGMRGFIGANISLAKTFGITFETGYNSIQIPGFTADKTYEVLTSPVRGFTAGQPVKKLGSSDTISADLSYAVLKTSLYVSF